MIWNARTVRLRSTFVQLFGVLEVFFREAKLTFCIVYNYKIVGHDSKDKYEPVHMLSHTF